MTSGFHGLASGGGSAARSTSGSPLVDFAILIKPEAPRSPRTGRLPRNVVAAQRESVDPEYRARMAAARAQLGRELFEGRETTLAGLRLRRGLSQHQLAAALGTSQPHIAKIEAGKTRIYLATAAKLAEALGVALEEVHRCVSTENNPTPFVKKS